MNFHKKLSQFALTLFLIAAIYWMLFVISTTIFPPGNPIAIATTALLGLPADFVAKPKIVEKVVTFDDWVTSDAVYTLFSGATIIVITGLFTLTKGRNVVEKYMLLQAYALPRQREHWGKVLDGVTQRPVSFAVVRLLSVANGVVETVVAQTVADLDGRYRLHSPAGLGSYFVEAQSSGYPPRRQKAEATFVEGEGMVRSTILLMKENQTIGRFSLRRYLFVDHRTELLAILTRFILVISFISFVLATYTLIFHFNFISIGNMIFYGFAFPWNVFVLSERRRFRPGIFINTKTNQGMPSVGVRLLLSSGKAISQFTDKTGMVRFDVDPGEYEIQISKEGFMIKDNPTNVVKAKLTSDGYLVDDIYLTPWREEASSDASLPNPFG